MGMSLDEYAKHVGKSTDDVKGEWTKLEKAQNIVLKNAKDAYKTAGMDMNTYMDTATSFSASLINALGGDTVKAAKQTDVAMRAISDNFNTFGGDIGMIKGAFQGFAKSNYTMLDNLKLGYGKLTVLP
jgi:phage-related protein